MANTVKLGSINFPKLMRQVGYRTNQVRDLVFARDAVHNKSTKTTKTGGTLSPPVNFGYESNLNTNVSSDTTDSLYHVITPELILPGLKAVQTPIVSRSGNLEQTGHRITGACTFYMPPMGYIRALDNFSETTQFSEIETFDKLIDIERVIEHPSDISASAQNHPITFDDKTPAYEIDRLQFKIKSSQTLDFVMITGNDGGTTTTLKWDGGMLLSSSAWITVDLPLRDIADTDTTLVYKDGVAYTYTAAVTNSFNLDKLHGADSTHDLVKLEFDGDGTSLVEIKDIYLYKEGEWRVESIKDYRDEYMEVAAVRVRGDRTSRRRAYG